MQKTLAVLGAGPGIGRAVADRFGAEGFRVGLVARDPQRLAAMVDELAGTGIEAAAFPADLRDRSGIAAAVEGITDRFGPVDVLEYGPISGSDEMVPADRVDADLAIASFELLVAGAVHAAGLVVPGMVERGDGALLLTGGISARVPLGALSGIGIASSGLRNWAYCLHEVLAPQGVYVGLVTVAAMVVRGGDPSNPMMIEADDVGRHHWDLYQARDHVEDVVGNPGYFTAPPGWA